MINSVVCIILQLKKKEKKWKDGKRYSTSNHKRAGVAILTDKINFKTKDVNREREALLTMIKRSSQQEEMSITNIHTCT